MNDIVPAGGILLIALIVTTGLALSRKHPSATEACALAAFIVIGAFLIAYFLGARYA